MTISTLSFYSRFWEASVNRKTSSASDSKNPPATQETWVRSLGREDALEKGMAIHSSILAWRILCTEEPGGLHPWSQKESGHD